MCLAGFLFCLVITTVPSLAVAAEAVSQSKLPGARPVIDAAEYPSLQAAIDAVPRDGGMVRLPPGEFVITEPLVIRHEDFRLEGAGTSTHIKNANADGKPAILIQSDDFTDAKKTKRKPLWRVMLSNFRVTGNEKSGHGIEAVWANELFIQGVTISYHGGDGIHCHFCLEDMRLNDSLITYNKKTGFYSIGNHDTIVSANQFEENLDALQFIDGFNLCMSGNNIDDHLRHGIVIENTYGSVVTGNMIEECQGTAIILDRDCYGIALTANVIAHHWEGGIDLKDAHGIAVSANAFPLAKKFGVRVSKDSDRIAITGNAFGDTYLGDGKWKRVGGSAIEDDGNASGGVILESTRDVTITGNSFTGVTTKPLTLTGECQRVIFNDNTDVSAAAK